LDDLLAIRDPNFTPTRFHIKDKEIADVLTNYAISLRNYGNDVLSGDFTVFIELEIIVKNRITQNK
jgi:hypothetical protein